MDKILPIIIIALIIITIVFLLSRFRRCPADKLMVIYGIVRNDENGKNRVICIHSGVAFIWPIIQSYKFLDLNPMTIDINFSALSKNNINIELDAKFSIGISSDEEIRQNAAKCLLGVSRDEIHEITENILIGTFRLKLKNKDAQEINLNNDELMSEVARKANDELNIIGINLINFQINHIRTLREHE